MRQAIITKFLGPTNFKGSRVKATAAGGSITVSWDHALNVDSNHLMAARALVEKMGWVPSQGERHAGLWVGGGLPDGSGNVYVYTSEGNYGDGWPTGTAFEV